jgi:hypothetical protein
VPTRPIDADQLRDLYLGQRLTVAHVSARLGLTPTTVRRRLKSFGIRARPRGPVAKPRRNVEWTSELAYAVGVITTDGCLSSNGRTLTVTSKDLDLLHTIRQCLGIETVIGKTANGRGHFYHRLQWTNRWFHQWLMEIGLMPAKSLRLGALAIPDVHFPDFARGCIDGDGSILTYVDRYHSFTKPKYVYNRLFVSLVSASPRFIEWMRDTVHRLLGVTGSVAVRRYAARRDIWCLRYAKRESLALLRWIYYRPDVPCLERKRARAAPLLIPRDRAPGRRPGRPMVL